MILQPPLQPSAPSQELPRSGLIPSQPSQPTPCDVAHLDSAPSDETIVAPEPRGVACRSCGKVHPGGRAVAGCPGPALRHGRSSTLLQRGELPSQADALAALTDRQSEIEADLGGAPNLSRVHRDAIRDLLRLELVGEFLFDRLLESGPLTGKGRTRAATMTYLQVLDRVQRLRQMVGLARVSRPVTSLTEALMAQPVRGRSDAD